MKTTKHSAALAFSVVAAVGTCQFASTVAAPVARADPLDGPRFAVERARADSTCPRLNYKSDLQGAAQRFARNVSAPTGLPHGSYALVYRNFGQGDPQSAANDALLTGAGGDIRDCMWTDFGVGFVREGELDTVTVALGEAEPPPAPASPAPFQAMPTVIGGDADVFDVAHDDVPDPTNGAVGRKIGTLKNGSQIYVGVPCKDGWCQVNSSVIQGGAGFVEQAHLKFP